MTAEQLARIAYPEKTKSLLVSKRNTAGEVIRQKTYAPGYQMTCRILNDLLSNKDKQGRRKKVEIKKQIIPYEDHPDLWMLPTTRRLNGLYQHEIICADVYVSYRDSSCWCEPAGEHLASLKLEPDRHMTWEGKQIFWEIDRGTESPKILREKLEKYIRYKEEIGKFFFVIFVIQDYRKDLELKMIADDERRDKARKEKQFKRAMEFDSIASEMNAGNQFLYTSQEWVVNRPFEKILCSPLQEAFSINDLR